MPIMWWTVGRITTGSSADKQEKGSTYSTAVLSDAPWQLILSLSANLRPLRPASLSGFIVARQPQVLAPCIRSDLRCQPHQRNDVRFPIFIIHNSCRNSNCFLSFDTSQQVYTIEKHCNLQKQTQHGLRLPAAASFLGRNSRLAGRGPSLASLFPPQAAVGSAAAAPYPYPGWTG